jgi:hypothetical protein
MEEGRSRNDFEIEMFEMEALGKAYDGETKGSQIERSDYLGQQVFTRRKTFKQIAHTVSQGRRGPPARWRLLLHRRCAVAVRARS